MSYLYTLFQSNLLEVLTLFLLIKGIKKKDLLIQVSLTNSLTHPLVFFGWMALPLPYGVNILLAEAFAIISEAFIYFKLWGVSLRRAFWLSLVANLVSWQFGPILTWAFFYSR